MSIENKPNKKNHSNILNIYYIIFNNARYIC